MEGEQLRVAWDRLNEKYSVEKIALMIAKTSSYKKYVAKYGRVSELNFSQIPHIVNELSSDYDIVSNVELDDLKREAFSHLTPNQIQIMELILSGYSYREISLIVGKKIGAISQIIRRVRQKLKKRMYNVYGGL